MSCSMEGNWQMLHHAAEKPMVAKGTQRFKRTFPLDQTSGVLISSAVDADEVLLQESSRQYIDFKLMRGLWTEEAGNRSGTFFPVAAPVGSGVLWCSAEHCLVPDTQQHWRCGYGTEVFSSSPSSQRQARAVVDLRWLTTGRPVSDLVEYSPSQPSHRIADADVMPDFGFMRAKAPESGVKQLFIPSAKQLQCGDMVCLLGFAHRPTAEWARIFLCTQADFDDAVEEATLRGLQPPAAADWRLTDHRACRRALDLLDDVCYPSRLVASPGVVVGASQRIIEHSCSTFPGMSGGPGVDVQDPWQLLFVHTRADADFRRGNYGYSVHHPLFVQAYEREVLPGLLDTPPDVLSQEMLRCLHGYLDANKDKLASPGVLHVVEKRCQVMSGGQISLGRAGLRPGKVSLTHERPACTAGM